MSNVFSYESAPMQMLLRLGDLILLNVCYLACCIPVFTIGAAQAGLYTACRTMQNREDDSSAVAAFWRGFRTGFGSVTIAWGILTVVLVAVMWLSIASMMAGGSVWLSVLAMVAVATFHALVPAFHSRFECTPWQLIRNTWFMLFAHPLRTLILTALLWAPVIVFVVNTYVFMSCAPIWISVYFSGAFSLSTALLKKPFKVLVDHFNETHGITPEVHEPSPNAVFTDVVETEEEEK